MIKKILAKSILVKNQSSDKWFGINYNANLYRGCSHGCIYCDSRSECYRIENFNDIEVKINALEVLDRELSSKKAKTMIGTGSMSDPYQPVEKVFQLTKGLLELIYKHNFAITIITKSNLILRDIELLKKINRKTKATVIFTLTTVNDEMAKKIEPNASFPSKRLEAMKILANEGITVGVLLQPVLPFLLDDIKNIESVIYQSSVHKASFIFPFFGVTLRDRQRTYFYHKLEEHFEKLRDRYEMTYKDSYCCKCLNHQLLCDIFKIACDRYHLIYEMEKIPTWIEKKNYQLNLFENKKSDV